MTAFPVDCRNEIVLDWKDSSYWNGGQHAACIHCSQPSLLLDDARRPAHKVCTQASLAVLINERKTTA